MPAPSKQGDERPERLHNTEEPPHGDPPPDPQDKVEEPPPSPDPDIPLPNPDESQSSCLETFL